MNQHPPLPRPYSEQRVPGASQSGNQFGPQLCWVAFRHSWLWAIPTGTVLACIAVFAVMHSFVPGYRASHLLEADQDYVVFPGVMPTIHNMANTDRQLFYNPIVIEPVLSDAKILRALKVSNAALAEAKLRDNLSVASGGTPTRMIVSFQDADPEVAALVCNAVVEAYLRKRDAMDNQRIAKLERWLEPEIAAWEAVIEERRERVEAYKVRTLGAETAPSVSMLENQNNLAHASTLRGQITDLELQLAVMDARQAMSKGEETKDTAPRINLDDIKKMKPTDSQIDLAISKDSEVREAQAMVQRYKGILLNMEDSGQVRLEGDRIIGANREYYLDMRAKRDKASSQVKTAQEAARIRVLERFDQLAEEDFQQRIVAAQRAAERLQAERLARAKQERDAIVTKLSVLQEEYEAERARLEEFGSDTAKLQFAQEELAVAGDVLKKLRDRMAALRTEQRAGHESTVQTLAAATPPKTPIEKLPLKKLVVAGGAAFVFPFLLGCLWEFRVQRVTDSATVEKCSGVAPVVGEVAILPSSDRNRRGRRMFEESIESLRANLFLSMQTKDTRSLAVASSMSGEGKSSVASQLALSIAKATGETVLLIDTDLRCPDQHDIFGLELGSGLCGVLAGEISLVEGIDCSLGDLIHVLPAGKLIGNPHRLLSPSAMREIVDMALGEYSYVVVDTAPVLSAGESLAVASAVDATLLCVMRDVSRMENVTRSMRRLEAAGANIAGTVFSGVSPRQYAYRYGDYQYAVESYS